MGIVRASDDSCNNAVQDPLHRVPGDLEAEVRERAADTRVAPPRILDRHPHDECGDLPWGHRPTAIAAGTAIVFLGDQSPVPVKNRVRRDDADHLRQDPPAEFLASHGESTALGIGQSKRRLPSCSRRTRFSSRR